MGSKPWLRDPYRFGCRNWTPVSIDSGSFSTVLPWGSVSSKLIRFDGDLSDC